MRRTALSSLSMSVALLLFGPSAIANELRMPPAVVGEWHADNHPCGTKRSAVDGLQFGNDGRYATLNGAENCQISKLVRYDWGGELGTWSFEATCQDAEKARSLSGAPTGRERRVTGSLKFLDDEKASGLVLSFSQQDGDAPGFFSPNAPINYVSATLQRCPAN